MQDADEDITPVATPIVAPSSANTTATTSTTGTTSVTESKKFGLEGSMNDVSLQEGTKPADSEQKSEEKGEVKKAEDEKPAVEDPQGYQVCDFETGMCYWVPANKSPDTTTTSTPVPEPAVTASVPDVVTSAEVVKEEAVKEEAAKEDAKVDKKEKLVKKDEEEVTLAPPVEITTTAPAEDKETEPSTATNTTKNKKDEAEAGAEQDGYQVCDFATGMCYWVPAKKAKVDPEQSTAASYVAEETERDETTKVVEPIVAAAVPSSPASGLDPGRVVVVEEAGSGARTPVSGSGSGSPSGQSPSPSPGSLNPGPRLVGKLSRDRLAMFENS
ncbi:MAG: hypothetical protein JOS17DRAFT_279569 [Linnemannia elongata]|nr:MAG: hypothetical protein JOS17DRAFT_279569 [Linnemannia elongata]